MRAVYPWRMGLPLALNAVEKGAILIAVTGIAAPLIGFALRRFVGNGWDAIGGGPFALLHEAPGRRRGGPLPKVDPAIQAAEVRQLLQAKSERRERRGEAPLDVEAETERLLTEASPATDRQEKFDAELREEVRQMVIARNDRRLRAGEEPLDVDAETERQLADLIGSS
jgi:hypothetical protein